MARGGVRSGQPGVAYPNRTDLTPAGPLPATAGPGQQYGAAGQQLAAQQQVPMAPPPAGPPAPPGVPAAPTAAPLSAGGAGGQPVPVPPPGPVPGAAGAFNRPTERPGEHVSTGLPVGMGTGPEVLPQAPDPVISGAALLNSLTQLSPQLAALKNVVNATLANRAAP